MSAIDFDVSATWHPQVPLTLNGSLQQLPSVPANRGVKLLAPASNAAIIKVGRSDVATAYFTIAPGGSEFIPVSNSNQICVIGTASDVLFVYVI